MKNIFAVMLTALLFAYTPSAIGAQADDRGAGGSQREPRIRESNGEAARQAREAREAKEAIERTIREAREASERAAREIKEANERAEREARQREAHEAAMREAAATREANLRAVHEAPGTDAGARKEHEARPHNVAERLVEVVIPNMERVHVNAIREEQLQQELDKRLNPSPSPAPQR